LLVVNIIITNKRMKTRSQTKKEMVLYEVIIDFDETSREWNKNKKLIGNGHYKYICLYNPTNDTNCGKRCYKESDYCWIHRKRQNNIY